MSSFKFFALALITLSSFTVAGQSKEKDEETFVVHDKGHSMRNVEVRKEVKGPANIVQIQALNISGGIGKIGGGGVLPGDIVLPGANITDVSLVEGKFSLKRETMKSAKGMTLQLLDVIFPLRVRVTISEQILDIEFKEAGFWKVTVRMNQ